MYSVIMAFAERPVDYAVELVLSGSTNGICAAWLFVSSTIPTSEAVKVVVALNYEVPRSLTIMIAADSAH